MMRAVSIPLFLVIVSLITAGCSHRTSTVRDEPHYVTEKSLTQETGNRTEENRAETSSWSVITDPVVLETDSRSLGDKEVLYPEITPETAWAFDSGYLNGVGDDEWPIVEDELDFPNDGPYDDDLFYRYHYSSYFGYFPSRYPPYWSHYPYFRYPWYYYPGHSFGRVAVIHDRSNGTVTTVGLWPPEPVFVSPLSDVNPFWGYSWGDPWYRYHLMPYHSFGYPWGGLWYPPYHLRPYNVPADKPPKTEPRESRPMIHERKTAPRISTPIPAIPSGASSRTPIYATAIEGKQAEKNSSSTLILSEPARSISQAERKNPSLTSSNIWGRSRYNHSIEPIRTMNEEENVPLDLFQSARKSRRIYTESKGTARSSWFTFLENVRIEADSSRSSNHSSFETSDFLPGKGTRQRGAFSSPRSQSAFDNDRFSIPLPRNTPNNKIRSPSHTNARTPSASAHNRSRSISPTMNTGSERSSFSSVRSSQSNRSISPSRSESSSKPKSNSKDSNSSQEH